MLANYARYYSTNSIKLGGVKIPHLYPGDELNLQTAQDSDNGFSALEQALLRYIAAGLGSLMSSFRVIILRSAIPAPAHLPMSPGAIYWGGAGSLPDGWRHKCFPAGWRRR